MIMNDDELLIVQEQVQRLERVIQSLRRDIWPLNPKQFRLMAEQYVETLHELRSDIDSYLGIDGLDASPDAVEATSS